MKYKIEQEMKLVESLKVLSYCCKRLEQACDGNAIYFSRPVLDDTDDEKVEYETGVFIEGISDSTLLMPGLKFCPFCGEPITCEGREFLQTETAIESEHVVIDNPETRFIASELAKQQEPYNDDKEMGGENNA